MFSTPVHRWIDVRKGSRRLLAVLVVMGWVLTSSLVPTAEAAVPSPTRSTSVITVKTGGNRTAATTVGNLAGVKLGLYANASDSATADGGAGWATCTSDANGDCSFVVPDTGTEGSNYDRRFYVKQISAPSGYFVNRSLGTDGASEDYVFRTEPMKPGQTYVSGTDFMNNTRTTTASGGVWQQSRNNPSFPAKCGISVAIVADVSGSVTPSQFEQLKKAANGFVDALTGTPSSVGVYTFATTSPANGPGNDTMALSTVSTKAGAEAVKAKINGLTKPSRERATNWDQALWNVASSSTKYDVVVVITDGNPTVYGTTYSPVDTRFQQVENGIFSANAVKAKGSRVVAFGVGDGVSNADSGLNLRAISGPTLNSDYYQTDDYEGAGQALRELALGNCEGSITVVKQVVPSSAPAGTTDGATPAAGWTMTASTSAKGLTIASPLSRTTAAQTGAVNYPLTFAGGVSSGAVTVVETPKAGYQLQQVGGKNATCTRVDTGAAVPSTNTENGFTVDANVNYPVSCTIYNRQEAPKSHLVLNKIVSGGSATLGDFTLKADGPTAFSGVDPDASTSTGLSKQVEPGTYALSETASGAGVGYIAYGWSCTVNGKPRTVTDNKVEVAAGETVVCTIENATPPTVKLVKDANPGVVGEFGGEVTYTFTVTNTWVKPVTIKSLTDDKFGTLAGDADCKVGTTLAPGASCQFTHKATLPPAAPGSTHKNVATVVVTDGICHDATASDDAVVTYEDVPPTVTIDKTADKTSVPETGTEVTYTFVVKNTSKEPVTITELKDDKLGELKGDDDCKVGTELAAGASCTFTHTTTLKGAAGSKHTNVATVVVKDKGGAPATDTDDETVTFTDVHPAVTVDKVANPTSVPESGADVKFTFTVKNTSDVKVTVDSLTDSVFGTLAGDDDCKVGTVLEPGKSCTFEETRRISGKPGEAHVNVFTAVVTDAEGNKAKDDDDAKVDFTDVKPDVSISKTADKGSVPESGAEVVFTFTVKNNAAEEATIASLKDSVFGDLAGDDDCKVGTKLAPGASCSFTHTAVIKGTAGTDHRNVVTVVVTDDDGNTDSGEDDETVKLTPQHLLWTKVDATTAALLAGSEWKLTGGNLPADGVTVTDCVQAPCTASTNDQWWVDQDPTAGKFELAKVPAGSYTLTETKAPAGYATGQAVKVTVVDGTAATTVGAVKNEQNGRAAWVKADATTKAVLGGATFQLSDGTHTWTVVDNTGQPGYQGYDFDTRPGHFLVEGMEFGTYTLKETVAPAGYLVDATPKTIEVKASDEVHSFGTFLDTPRVLGRTITKTAYEYVGTGTVTPSDGLIDYGSRVAFGMEVKNTGNDTQTDVVVSDVLPEGMTYVAGSAECSGLGCTTSYDAATRTVTWTVPSLPAGASFTAWVSATAPAAPTGAGTHTWTGNNVAAVTSVEDPDKDPSNTVTVRSTTTVLGSTITLPKTGAPVSMVAVALALSALLGGAALVVVARRKASRQ